jgi:hypothetical protein
MHFFGFFGLAATGAGVMSGSLLLFQKVAARAVLASNATLTFATIALLLAGAQIMCVGLASEISSRTYYESQKKPIYVSRPKRIPDVDLRFTQEVAVSLEEDSADNFENLGNQSQLAAHSLAKRAMPAEPGDRPKLGHKIPRNGLA